MMALGRVLRTGLSSLRDRAAARLAALRFNPSRWDWAEIWLCAAIICVLIIVSEGAKFPDPLPLALVAIVLAIGRMKDRYERRILGLQRAVIQLQRIEIERQ
jgi:hypothetical protein